MHEDEDGLGRPLPRRHDIELLQRVRAIGDVALDLQTGNRILGLQRIEDEARLAGVVHVGHRRDRLGDVGRQIGADERGNRDRRDGKRNEESVHGHLLRRFTGRRAPPIKFEGEDAAGAAPEQAYCIASLTALAAAAIASLLNGIHPCIEKKPWIIVG